MRNQGTYGYYWSSTAWTSATRAYSLDLNSSGTVLPASSSNKYTGFSLRCLAENRLDILIYHNYNIIMIRFEWDGAKNRANMLKHGVSFEEASSVFYDINALLLDDPDHSKEEDRFLIIGVSRRLRICIVSHCYRSDNEVIRIISARKATKLEKKSYKGQGDSI